MSEKITALDLPAQQLSPGMQKYFDVCRDKLGMVPNVLVSLTFDEVAGA